MPVVNSVGNVLTGVTGTGTFVGSTSATLTTPRINAIHDSTGTQVLALAGTAGCRLSLTAGTSSNFSIGVAGSSGTDLSFATQFNGLFKYRTGSSSLVFQILTANGATENNLYFPSTLGTCAINFPAAATQTLCADSSNSGSITTAPPASTAPSLSLGSAFRNTLGYDVNITVYLAVSAATSADILLGVGPTSSPTQQTIISGITLAALNVIPIQIYLPAQYYALLSTSGTITQSISGQIQIPV